MSDLILPRRASSMDNSERMKLTVIAISTASYARMFQLMFEAQKGDLEPDQERDLKRLMAWYTNLGAERKDKLDSWIYDLSRNTEDVTEHSGRKVDNANQQAMKKITKWESNQ